MRRYASADEERIHVQAQVREWTRAGLLDSAQGAALEAEVCTDLRRTNRVLRAVLALFTGVIVAASVALVAVSFGIRGEIAVAVTTGLAALVCITAAESLVAVFRVYRFGVEEMLAVSAVLLLSVSAAEVTWTFHGGRRGEASIIVALAVGAVGGFAIYRRFGLAYAAVGAMLCAAIIPFQFSAAHSVQRVIAAATLASVFASARAMYLRHEDDFLDDEYAMLQAAAWGGVYLTLNLHAFDVVGLPFTRMGGNGRFYWCTYAITWIMPAVGLGVGIREKDRALMQVSLVMALATVATNTPYLGWPRRTWDPSVLGLLLMAIAIALRRWLARGPGGERGGFTPVRLLEADRDALTLVGTASVGWQGHTPVPAAAPPSSDFNGGRSGGGGGGAGF